MSKGNKKAKGNGIIALIFCLPLAAIICFLIYYSSLGSVNKVVLSTPDTKEFKYEAQAEVDFFVNMLQNSIPISTAMRDVSGEKPVYITLYPGDDPLVYKLYPSLNLSGCLLVSPDGDLYFLETETAKRLLLREEFDYLYSSYFLPELSVVSGEREYNVNPVECVWNYYKTDGKQYSYSPENLSDGKEMFVVLKGAENSLKFTPDGEVRPYDLSDVSYVSEDGTEYSITDISQLDLSFDTVLTVSFTAKWNSMNGAQASGEAKYKFKVLYDVPAVVELADKEFSVGDVITVTATHLNENETVSLETLLNVPRFSFTMLEGSSGVALIPIGISNSEAQYTLKITTGTETISEIINVSAIDDGTWTPFEVTEEEYNASLSSQRLEAFYSVIAEVAKTRPEGKYFNYGENSFLPPVSSQSPSFVYGQSVNFGTVGSISDSGEQICQGVVYELAEGTSVRSAQAGVVVFSGELAPTGNTVIVYHGYGIYTYYYHLDSLNVRTGYTLTDGEIIGVAGQSGFTNGKTVLHYAVSIDGVFVNPDFLYN